MAGSLTISGPTEGADVAAARLRGEVRAAAGATVSLTGTPHYIFFIFRSLFINLHSFCKI